MIEVLFIYEGQEIVIQSKKEDKIKDIADKLKNKIGEDDINLLYIYNGGKINKELTLSQIEGKIEKKEKY